jgi:hydrogenase nickel insertion protein HypA
MHEAGMIRSAVRTVLDELQRSGAQRVTGVRLAVTASGHATEESIRQLYAMASEGTQTAGAIVSISWLPSDYWCPSCSHRLTPREPSQEVACPQCGGAVTDVAHHDVCYVESIDVE